MKPVRVELTSVADKERAIRSGRSHYSEMLSPEMIPDETYMRLYRAALARNAKRLAGDVGYLAGEILRTVGPQPVIVSLARAGTPIGVLLQRALRRRKVRSAHYSVSIIRDRGIDLVAMEAIINRHGDKNIVFVDGWTGKGTINRELRHALSGTVIPSRLCVVADPAGVADISATCSDYLIPSGILNGIVSGLVSRSVLNEQYVGPGDFHACMFLEEHSEADETMAFIEAIEAEARNGNPRPVTGSRSTTTRDASIRSIQNVMLQFAINDPNHIKPGIAESTRALLRRMPRAICLGDRGDQDLLHLYHLAEFKGVDMSTAEQNPATRRRKSRPLGGASGERREGVARPEFPACGVGDFGEGFSLPFGRGFGRDGSFRRSSRGC